MTYTPRTFRKGTQSAVAHNYSSETDLLFDGWLPDPSTPPAADPHRHIQADEIATLPELKAAFGPGNLLSRLVRQGAKAVPRVAATSPTITWSTTRTMTSLLVPPAPPHAAWLGHKATMDATFGFWLADRAGSGMGLEFVYTGQVLEWGYQANNNYNDARVWIWVDGEPLTPGYITPGVLGSPGEQILCKMDFGSSATRTITIYGAYLRSWHQIGIGPTDTVSAPTHRRPRIAVIGDSFCGGSDGTPQPLDLPPMVAGFQLGAEIINCGVGGSGYVNIGQDGSAFGSPSRIAMAGVAGPLDAIVFVGSVNDGDATNLTDAATACYAAYAQAFPGVPIVVLGPQASNAGATISAERASAIRKVKAACDASPNVIAFYDMVGTLGGLPPAWPGNPYTVQTGDRVTHLGAVWEWNRSEPADWGIPGHHGEWSLITWDYWGAGDVSSHQGGSRDVLLHSDGVHPTTTASRLLGYRIADCVRRALTRR